MAKKTADGKWIHSNGKAVAVTDVRPDHRERDRTVERLFARIKRLQQQMEDEKKAILEEVEEYKAIISAEYDASFSETGGITLTNFSGDKQVELKVNKQVQHDEKLDLAENLMRQALNETIEAIRTELNGTKARSALQSLKNIESIIDNAFALNESGNVARHRIISLKQVKMQHPKWRKALMLIGESEVVRGTRQYLYAREREELTEKYESLDLNFTLL